MKGNRPPEGEEERAARELVRSTLGVPVIREDDGREDNQVDALIHMPEGICPLEVVSVPRPELRSQIEKLNREGRTIEMPCLTGSYAVLLDAGARVGDLRDLLARELPRLEEVLVGPLWHNALPLSLRGHGVAGVVPITPESGLPGSEGQAGIVHLRVLHGWALAGEDALPAAVESFLASGLGERKIAKLAAIDGVPQRHLFIWARERFSQKLIGAYAGGALMQPPRADPRVPACLTHLWIAGDWTHGALLSWSREAGWARHQT